MQIIMRFNNNNHLSSSWFIALLATLLCATFIPPTSSSPQASVPVAWKSQIDALSGKYNNYDKKYN